MGKRALSDATIQAILTAPQEVTHKELAERFACSASIVQETRMGIKNRSMFPNLPRLPQRPNLATPHTLLPCRQIHQIVTNPHNLTTKQLTEKYGICKTTVWSYQNGHTPIRYSRWLEIQN